MSQHWSRGHKSVTYAAFESALLFSPAGGCCGWTRGQRSWKTCVPCNWVPKDKTLQRLNLYFCLRLQKGSVSCCTYRRVLWVDAWTKKLYSAPVDGDGDVTALVDLSPYFGDNPAFGLAVVEGTALISVWGSGQVRITNAPSTKLVWHALNVDAFHWKLSVEPYLDLTGAKPSVLSQLLPTAFPTLLWSRLLGVRTFWGPLMFSVWKLASSTMKTVCFAGAILTLHTV